MSTMNVSPECASGHHTACNSVNCDCHCHVEFDTLDCEEASEEELEEQAR